MTLTTEQIMNVIRYLTKDQGFIKNEPTSDIIETDWNHFLSSRRFMYPTEDTQEFKGFEEQINCLNKSIICFIPKDCDKHKAEKKFEEIDECFASIYTECNEYGFERGVLEGFILAFNLFAPKIMDNKIDVT